MDIGARITADSTAAGRNHRAVRAVAVEQDGTRPLRSRGGNARWSAGKIKITAANGGVDIRGVVESVGEINGIGVV